MCKKSSDQAILISCVCVDCLQVDTADKFTFYGQKTLFSGINMLCAGHTTDTKCSFLYSSLRSNYMATVRRKSMHSNHFFC